MAQTFSKQIHTAVLVLSLIGAAQSGFANAATMAGNVGSSSSDQQTVVSDHQEETARKPLSRSQRRQMCFDSANAWFHQMEAMCSAENPNSREDFEECMFAPSAQYNSEIRHCQAI